MENADNIYRGDLTITVKNRNDFAHIVKVTGGLIIDAEASLPVLTTVGGDLSISIGVNFDYSAIEFGAGLVLAVWEYALHLKDGKYCAGCMGPLTADEALKHWTTGHHAPSRATLFRVAIEAQKVAA